MQMSYNRQFQELGDRFRTLGLISIAYTILHFFESIFILLPLSLFLSLFLFLVQIFIIRDAFSASKEEKNHGLRKFAMLFAISLALYPSGLVFLILLNRSSYQSLGFHRRAFLFSYY